MLGNRIGRAVKIQNGMAIFAFVSIRRGGKLPVMGILVTVGAEGEFYFIDGVLSRRQVTLFAGNRDVFALQRVFGCVVLFHAEKRGLPSIDVVAFRALALFGARFELALVGVRFMTIIAVIERQLLFEISLQVAFRTADHDVLSEERVLGLGMVEFKARQQFLPSCGGVTFFAALLEGAFVRINVAVDAGLELHVPVACRAARHIGLVALLALDFDVKTRQGIAGLGVIELLCRFPVRVIMALQAIVPKLAFVHIFVARHAILCKPEERLRKILHFDERAVIANHESRRVALFAGDPSVLSFQLVAGLAMIKLFLRRLPVDQAKVFSVVIQMTANAILAIGVGYLKLIVIAVLGRKPLGDFLVALEALESGRAGAKLVAAIALRSSAQRLMRFGKGTGGDLRACRMGRT
ncbi:MAG TPA: hypothetical protein VMO76_03715 [Candidatus Udaeobacter sp.]|nr:hypothetical protein [Candidatus Udaeobacter sp.]